MNVFSNGLCYILALLRHLGYFRTFFCSLIKLGKGALGKSQTQFRKTLSPQDKKRSYYLFCSSHLNTSYLAR